MVLKPQAVYRVGRQTHVEGKTPYRQPEPIYDWKEYDRRVAGSDGSFSGTRGCEWRLRWHEWRPLPTKVSADNLFTDYTAYVAVGDLIHIRRADRVLIENVTLDETRQNTSWAGSGGTVGGSARHLPWCWIMSRMPFLKDVICRENALDGITICRAIRSLGDPPFAADRPERHTG